jgi:hypothetical protein
MADVQGVPLEALPSRRAQKSHAKMTGTLAMRGLGSTSMNLIKEAMRQAVAMRRLASVLHAMFHVKH